MFWPLGAEVAGEKKQEPEPLPKKTRTGAAKIMRLLENQIIRKLYIFHFSLSKIDSFYYLKKNVLTDSNLTKKQSRSRLSGRCRNGADWEENQEPLEKNQELEPQNKNNAAPQPWSTHLKN